MPIDFSPLPYPTHALEPNISQRTLEFHWGKHHRGYVEKLNKLIAGTKFENLSLEEIILESAQMDDKSIFNNAAQAWNHDFFWRCLSPKTSRTSGKEIKEEIKKQFGSLEKFHDEFIEKGKALFGSGWTWLIKNTEGELEILNTPDAENPLSLGQTALLVCDVWEHAYYLDYQNARDKFLAHFWDLINWDFAEENFKATPAIINQDHGLQPNVNRH